MQKLRNITSVDKLLSVKIDLADLMHNLNFSDEQTAEAAQIQPHLFMLAATFSVQKQKRRLRYEAKLKLVRSELAKKIRNELAELGQRVTDKQVEETIIRKKEVIKLEAKLDNCIVEEQTGKLLIEALRARSASLKIVSELIGAEVYVARKMGDGDNEFAEIKKRLKEKYPGRVTKEERKHIH
jgi:cob(I)alamin adenosyltransferase